MVNDCDIRSGDFTLWLDCDSGLDRDGAAWLAFVLMFWSQWGELPDKESIDRAMQWQIH